MKKTAKKVNSMLPCPFCGSECVIENTTFGDSLTPYYRVTCREGHSLDWWDDTQQEAIDTWNQRGEIK